MFEQKPYNPHITSKRQVNTSHMLVYDKVINGSLGEKLENQSISWVTALALEVAPEVSTGMNIHKFENLTFTKKVVTLGKAAIETGLMHQAFGINSLDTLSTRFDMISAKFEAVKEKIVAPFKKLGNFVLGVVRKGGELLNKAVDAFNDAGDWVKAAPAKIELARVAIHGGYDDDAHRYGKHAAGRNASDLIARLSALQNAREPQTSRPITGIDWLEAQLY